MKHRDEMDRAATRRVSAIRADRDRLQGALVRHAIGGVLFCAGMAALLGVALLSGGLS
ncbi:hypothetical protein [uncultured Martelella sp.]|uniref:hypothetical protein n=1 Tax=uncultured Martelella sp. TaxID=392331 RepID=UPI0029C8A053|nr:hypothetical protein [uncultured Martelella sp.]